VNDRITMRLGNWSRVVTPLLLLQMRPRFGLDPNDLRPIDKVGKLSCPKLFIAGSKDMHTTLAESQRLFDAAAAPKEFWIVDGAAHQDLHNAATTEYEKRVMNFFQQHLQ